jgi:hypothetical protein
LESNSAVFRTRSSDERGFLHFAGFLKARVSYQALVKRCRFGCEPECNRKFIVGLGPANGDAKETENMLEEDK